MIKEDIVVFACLENTWFLFSDAQIQKSILVETKMENFSLKRKF